MTLNHFDQRPVPATDSTPDSAPSSPPGIASIADALREAARLAAVRDLLAEREQELRAWLEAKAAAHTAAEGTAFNCPVKGLGRAYVTEPGIRLEPLDRAAFGAWALANRPGDARRRGPGRAAPGTARRPQGGEGERPAERGAAGRLGGDLRRDRRRHRGRRRDRRDRASSRRPQLVASPGHQGRPARQASLRRRAAPSLADARPARRAPRTFGCCPRGTARRGTAGGVRPPGSGVRRWNI